MKYKVGDKVVIPAIITEVDETGILLKVRLNSKYEFWLGLSEIGTGEMTAMEFLKEWRRMCEITECHGCRIGDESGFSSCRMWSLENPEKAISIVQNWAKENPAKTMMDDFFEKFPNAPKKINGEPSCCPHHCGYTDDNSCEFKNCFKCWTRPLEVE